MRFSYAEAMCDPSFYVPLAKAAEAAGYDSFVVPDNLGYPGASDARYPYTPDGDNSFLEGKPFLEPFTVIPAMGAVTQRLRFTTLVVKLPVRLPYIVAKQSTSIAVLTQNRFALGVGLSPWPEDFAVCGQEWRSRGRRMDEMIEIIRGLGTGEFYEYKGEHYEIRRIKMCPVPTEPIPILIGGHSEPALRRAARVGDGWMHAGGGDGVPLEDLLERLGELRREYGRDHLPFEVHAISLDGFSADGVRRLEDLGVTDVIVGFRNVYQQGPDSQTLDEKIDALNRFADNVISAVR
ncbi:MAG: TIGR03619 family F420-dependent LLM class oxidoreductase [Deltaproteobacteria bacterium]|jgi:probable F420-dependent oxidoreductase|nr:TIGR03619 family F420-dependent LLM class oxidoreductase [Deltaproteobacteria bacterium]MBW2401219.1 TIGR03619 family F420-dependent LLM class oxidoreductase [Deltaproteobacteria bacterium]MBW2667991.1 TIGR03619 family F420-dependent LLM class oxidoreductase [Deltaproteobacteria bacterium]